MEIAVPSTPRIWIPAITDLRLTDLAWRIKPILRFAQRGQTLILSPQGFPYYIKSDRQPKKKTYFSNPQPDRRAVGLEGICDLKTYHKYSHPDSFSPSVAEVIAAIPEEYLSVVVAFEIVETPLTMEDLRKDPEAFAAGYHVAITRLYSGR